VIVQTETAVYVLNPLEGVLTRYPRQELDREWYVAELRKDHQIIPYRLHPHFPLEVGKPAVFILNIRNDGVETVRTTTPVVSIEGGE
jgi:hypothetical protein